MNKISQSVFSRFLVAAGVALAVQQVALAHGGERAGMPPDGVPPHLKVLNLSEAQRDEVFDIMHAQMPVMREKAKAMHRAEDDLRALGASVDYSEARAKVLADASAKAMSEMSLLRVRTDHQIFELLTPEQRKQLAEFKERPDAGRGDAMHGPASSSSGRPPMR